MDLCSETGRVPNSCQARDGLKQLLAPCAEAVTAAALSWNTPTPWVFPGSSPQVTTWTITQYLDLKAKKWKGT